MASIAPSTPDFCALHWKFWRVFFLTHQVSGSVYKNSVLNTFTWNCSCLLPWLQLMSLKFVVSTFCYTSVLSVHAYNLLLFIFTWLFLKQLKFGLSISELVYLLTSDFLLLYSFSQWMMPPPFIKLSKLETWAWPKFFYHQILLFHFPQPLPCSSPQLFLA